MQGNRSRDTKPELLVRRAVHALGLRYRVNVRPESGLRRTADIVFPRPRVAIFIDGCYWHGCEDHCRLPTTNHVYWSTKIGGNKRRDAETTASLAAKGWTVLRYWAHENPVTVAESIRSKVRDAVPSNVPAPDFGQSSP